MVISKGFLAIALYSCSLYLHADTLLNTTKSWDGRSIHYPAGKAHITSVKYLIDERDELPFHCHPIPTFGYILKGGVEVETIDGKKAIFNQGDSVVEVMRTIHRGRAINGPVEIIVFYAGAETIPHTVLPENDPENKYCDY